MGVPKSRKPTSAPYSSKQTGSGRIASSKHLHHIHHVP
jgi:hypothetical protein